MNKILKKGSLYWLPLNCQSDIEKWPKWCRLTWRFWLRPYDQVFLREDKSKWSRQIVDFCKKKGIETFVVQEGDGPASGNPWGHLPLRADYFLCPEKDRQWWLDQGMPKDRIQTYVMQKEAHQYDEIVFLHPFYTADNFLHPSYWDHKNTKVMRVVMDFMQRDVVFKLHNKNKEIMERFIPFNRRVTGDAKELIKKYKKVYCFGDSSIKRDCEMLNVPCEVL